MRSAGWCPGIALVVVLASGPARAQLSGDLVPGTYGLTAGTAPDVGLNVSLSVQEYYTTVLVGPGGSAVHSPDTYNALVIPALSLWWVSPWKLLGGNFGAQLSLQGTSSVTEYPRIDSRQHGYGFGDMWIQPVGLSWHTTYADVLTGFALYLPTGRYQPDGTDNTGQGQWGYELSAGATVWLDAGHHFNFAAIVLYDIYSPKQGTDGQLRTGSILTVQGAVGYQLLGGALNVGIPYSFQFKITEDTLPQGFFPPDVLARLDAAKSWSAAVGLEVDYTWSAADGIQLRWLQGFAGTNTTNGTSLLFFYSHQFSF